MDDAQRAIQNLRRLDPARRLSNLKDWLLFHRPEYLTTFQRLAASRIAGVARPEWLWDRLASTSRPMSLHGGRLGHGK
jgi:hypothetical protein